METGDVRIAVEWFPDPTEAAEDLEQDAQRLRAADPDGEVQVVNSQGVLPVVGWIIGALLVVVLAREISDLVCRVTHKGMIIDARGDGSLKIRKNSDLPGGTVLIIHKNSTTETVSVCDGKANLAEMIKSAAGVG
jgi:hypothetical protein